MVLLNLTMLYLFLEVSRLYSNYKAVYKDVINAIIGTKVLNYLLAAFFTVQIQFCTYKYKSQGNSTVHCVCLL